MQIEYMKEFGENTSAYSFEHTSVFVLRSGIMTEGPDIYEDFSFTYNDQTILHHVKQACLYTENDLEALLFLGKKNGIVVMKKEKSPDKN